MMMILKRPNIKPTRIKKSPGAPLTFHQKGICMYCRCGSILKTGAMYNRVRHQQHCYVKAPVDGAFPKPSGIRDTQPKMILLYRYHNRPRTVVISPMLAVRRVNLIAIAAGANDVKCACTRCIPDALSYYVANEKCTIPQDRPVQSQPSSRSPRQDGHCTVWEMPLPLSIGKNPVYRSICLVHSQNLRGPVIIAQFCRRCIP